MDKLSDDDAKNIIDTKLAPRIQLLIDEVNKITGPMGIYIGADIRWIVQDVNDNNPNQEKDND